MPEADLEILPKEIIRTETVLSRFPIHRLSKKGDISIDIKIRDKNGELKTTWEVDYSAKHGQPTALAYKLDTLVINRRIEEAGKPVPKLIRLGSLRDIAKQLGSNSSGENLNSIKKALRQNAFTNILAKFTYKAASGEEKHIEIADTRYAVIFTGETLPNDRKADSTYILLHDLYREILNSAPTRPLDYEYLKRLPPMAQRFYELLSYQMYGAVKNTRAAKLLYSEFCTYAPQTRFFDWEQVRPQMHRIHKPHLESGYIETIAFEKLRVEDGTPDWLFIYTAGRKAKGEHTFAARTHLPRAKQIKVNPIQPPLIPDEPRPALVPDVELTFSAEEEDLISKMRAFRVSEGKARSLAKSHRNAVEREILYFPYRTLGNVKNAAGLFVKAVLENYEPPQSYFDSLKVAATKEQAAKQAEEAERKAKLRDEERKSWQRAEKKLRELPEAERQRLWEQKRQSILAEPEYRNADGAKLKILESVLDGLIRAAIIEDFTRSDVL